MVDLVVCQSGRDLEIGRQEQVSGFSSELTLLHLSCTESKSILLTEVGITIQNVCFGAIAFIKARL